MWKEGLQEQSGGKMQGWSESVGRMEQEMQGGMEQWRDGMMKESRDEKLSDGRRNGRNQEYGGIE